MLDAPRQNWKAYAAMTAESDAARLRELTVEEKFAIYADMWRIARQARQGPGDWDNLDRHLWQEKLALRNRLVEAFRKVDEFYAERAARKVTA